MERPPTISIVTPSYHQAQYLERTLRSVLDQEYPNLEYVVIDGGSTDGSADIIRKHAGRLAYWVSEPDHGHADGLQKGFLRTTGEIMAWINSSDVYYPWTLRTVAQIFEDVPEARWIVGVPSYIGPDGAPKGVGGQFFNMYDFLAGDYVWVQQESVFWRRDLWDDAGGHLDASSRYACDFELWLRFFRLAPLWHVDTILGGFRFHDDRRGGVGNDAYAAEAARYFSAFKRAFSRRELARAQLVGLTNNPPGRLLRKGLTRSGIWPWYRHPRIDYDFQVGRWMVR